MSNIVERNKKRGNSVDPEIFKANIAQAPVEIQYFEWLYHPEKWQVVTWGVGDNIKTRLLPIVYTYRYVNGVNHFLGRVGEDTSIQWNSTAEGLRNAFVKNNGLEIFDIDRVGEYMRVFESPAGMIYHNQFVTVYSDGKAYCDSDRFYDWLADCVDNKKIDMRLTTHILRELKSSIQRSLQSNCNVPNQENEKRALSLVADLEVKVDREEREKSKPAPSSSVLRSRNKQLNIEE